MPGMATLYLDKQRYVSFSMFERGGLWPMFIVCVGNIQSIV